MFPNALAKPLIIPPAVAGVQAAAAAAALSRGSEAICVEAELIFSLDRKWKVTQAALMFSVVTFWVSARPQTKCCHECHECHEFCHRSRFDGVLLK